MLDSFLLAQPYDVQYALSNAIIRVLDRAFRDLFAVGPLVPSLTRSSADRSCRLALAGPDIPRPIDRFLCRGHPGDTGVRPRPAGNHLRPQRPIRPGRPGSYLRSPA